MNIPKQLLSDIKNDKCRCEALALSICIKSMNDDSLLRNVSATKIQTILHCGFNKAKAILDFAKTDNRLFYYNSYTNNLLAKDFKKKYINKCCDKKGRDIYEMYAIKFDRRDDYTLRGLLSMFKRSLMLCAVNYETRRDEFTCKTNTTTSSTSKRDLTLKRLSNITGASKSYVYRMTRKMVGEEKISTTRPCLTYVSNCTSDEAMEYQNHVQGNFIYNDKDGNLYKIESKKYTILKRDINSRFVNIIFNHHKRHTFFDKKETFSNAREQYLNDYFSRFEH